MRTYRRTIGAMVAGVAMAAVVAGMMPVAMAEDSATPAQLVPVKRKPVVQIAILLDTSNSMDGLIEQAKTQLWKVVNEFAKAQRDGVRPEIQVALYQYGTPSLGKETGYIKQLVPLSTDLDKVSEELFKLRTDGGDEYCGAVIKTAAEQLAWSKDKGAGAAYKAIFIAGNEPFTQGDVKFEDACKEAIAAGIVVNTIYCGDEQQGIRGKWKDGALLADGSYMSINQNAVVVHIDAPQDKELAELSATINKTYVAYGRGGGGGQARQLAQDSNAQAAAPAAEAERAVSKANGTYHNGTWDLVDAVKEKQVELKDVKADDLPEEMKKLDEKGREAYVQEKQKEREAIQAKILQLSGERDKFIAAKQKEGAGDKTLDRAMVETVRTQAKNAGMTFEK